MSSVIAQFSEVVKDVSVLRRMLFAVATIPNDHPKVWEVVVQFGVGQTGERNKITPEQAKLLFENVWELNQEAFKSDNSLMVELSQLTLTPSTTPIGIILMSTVTDCINCGRKLSIRADRPSQVIIYDDELGTLPGTQYQKYCRKPGCRLYQYYGYHTTGANGKIVYDTNWHALPYFVSTQRTVFKLSMLKKFDVELLIGQLSYKQKADIYNYAHGYISDQEVNDKM